MSFFKLFPPPEKSFSLICTSINTAYSSKPSRFSLVQPVRVKPSSLSPAVTALVFCQAIIVTSQWDDEQLKSMDCVLLVSVSPYSSGSRSSVMLGWDLQGHVNFIYMISSISQFPMEAALGCLKWEGQICCCCCCFNGERWRERWAGAFKLLSTMPSEPWKKQRWWSVEEEVGKE